MKLLARICKLLKALIDDKQRCLAWCGIAFGALFTALATVLIIWGFIDHSTIAVIAPLMRDLALACAALLIGIVFNFRNRKISATINGNSIDISGPEGGA